MGFGWVGWGEELRDWSFGGWEIEHRCYWNSSNLIG